ncbi:MAG: hypothetical protein GEV11_26885 [Streptosporangiales bacterium]|nr:hypothetical protein [Streptosporangiales bacterium]
MRRKPVAFGAVAVVAAGLVIGAFALSSDGDNPPGTPVVSASPTPRDTGASSPPAEDGGDEDGGDKGKGKGKGGGENGKGKGKGGPHAGYREYKDESGFALQVPVDWQRETRGNSVFFRARDGGYLQIDQTDSPKDDAVADWKNQEASAAGRFGSYRLIGIRPLPGPYVTAADWEFTFRSGGTAMHAINRAMVTDEEHGYALFLVAPASEWETAKQRLAIFTSTFEPDK